MLEKKMQFFFLLRREGEKKIKNRFFLLRAYVIKRDHQVYVFLGKNVGFALMPIGNQKSKMGSGLCG